MTAAAAPKWLKTSGLDVNEFGFVRVRDTLPTTTHDNIFASGDIASLIDHPRPKAGVFAVRQGSPLAKNIRSVLVGGKARPFSPQKSFLKLISTGDKNAVAAKWGWTLEGALVWQWKNWIDRRFVRRFSNIPEISEN